MFTPAFLLFIYCLKIQLRLVDHDEAPQRGVGTPTRPSQDRHGTGDGAARSVDWSQRLTYSDEWELRGDHPRRNMSGFKGRLGQRKQDG